MNYTIAIHGGAGTILKSEMTSKQEADYQDALNEALTAGYEILDKGGSSLDAVELAVICLENCPLFNAGKGSVFTNQGTHEMDASIMNGVDQSAGAVAMLHAVKNPINLARLVMEKTSHVLLAGQGAMDFANQMKVEMKNDDYFFNEYRYQQWLSVKESPDMILDHTSSKNKKLGTVGAVALDQFGNMAAATSTGGMTNKKFGRIGDTPIIGSGTYANNKTCAISCTGSGEYFIRCNAAFHVHSLMKYANFNLTDACNEVVHNILIELGGNGGLIGIDYQGNVCLSFNTEGMYRAFKKSNGERFVGIYK